MRFYVITVFPAIFESPLQETILKRAQDKGLVQIDVIELRQFSGNKHQKLDDTPYGGGPGMVMRVDPIARAFESLPVKKGDEKTRFIYTSPQGKPLTQEKLNDLSQYENIVLLCGRYRGVDQRVLDSLIDEEISIGDYVLSGGEIPALVIIDGVSRLVPGVLGNSESAEIDSFQTWLFDHPVYTKPEEWKGMKVPEVLLSGNHRLIEEWRQEKAIKKTAGNRKDLYERYLAQSEVKNNE